MTEPEIVKKVYVAISFGSPSEVVTREIMGELRSIVTRLENVEKDRDTTALALQAALNKLARVLEIAKECHGDQYEHGVALLLMEALND